MLESFYDRLISCAVTKNLISNEEKTLYKYGLKILTQSILNVIGVIIAGILLGMLKESLVMFASFFVLRKFMGGLHLDKFTYCYISSLLIHIFGLLYVKQPWLIPKEIFIILLILSVVSVLCLAPVEHPNKRHTNKEKKVYKLIACTSSVFLCLVSILAILSQNFIWVGSSIGISLIISSTLMCIGKVVLSFK